MKDIRGIRHFKEEPDPVVELGRICYRSNSARLYLPKRICNKLRLDWEKDTTFVIVAQEPNSLFLIKDSAVATKLRPRVLELRRLEALKRRYNG